VYICPANCEKFVFAHYFKNYWGGIAHFACWSLRHCPHLTRLKQLLEILQNAVNIGLEG
jgi:hypothetical protein